MTFIAAGSRFELAKLQHDAVGRAACLVPFVDKARLSSSSRFVATLPWDYGFAVRYHNLLFVNVKQRTS